MKKFLVPLASVMITIVTVMVVKAKNLDAPPCPEGTTIFYYWLDSNVYNSPSDLLNPDNYRRFPPPTAWAECEGTTRLCAICAVLANPTDPVPVWEQRPSFWDESSHTGAVVNALNNYSSGNTPWTDDSITGLIFEKDNL